MGSHPLNLALRFLLELASIAAVGLWGWERLPAGWRWVGVWLLPAAWMAVWGVFAVPGDPSRGGTPAVPVPGSLRLAIEACAFAAGAFCLGVTRGDGIGWALAAATALHYALSLDRVQWLLQR